MASIMEKGSFCVPNKNLRPLVKPDDQTKFELARMIFQLAMTKHSKIQKTFYSKFIMAILNLSNILERIFLTKSMNETHENIPVKI